MHGPRHEHPGHLDAAAVTRQVMNVIALDGRGHGRAHVPPVGVQLIQRGWLEYVARQDMRADLRAFFHNNDGEALIQLHEAACGGKAGRPAADDNDVEFHGFAFDSFSHDCPFFLMFDGGRPDGASGDSECRIVTLTATSSQRQPAILH